MKGESWNKVGYLFPDQVEEMLLDHGGNFGIALSNEDLVIDYDPRNADKGDNPLKRFVKDCGLNPRQFTAAVKTGGGGLHLYLRKPKDVKITKNPKQDGVEIYKGVDFLSKGSYVVGMSSIHESGKAYTHVKGYQKFSEIKVAPSPLLEILTKRETAVVKEDFEGVECQDEIPSTIDRFVEYLGKVEPAVEGASGDKNTFFVACKGRDLGLSAEKVLDLMLEHFNPRCSPPWEPDEMLKKVNNAYEYAVGDKGQDLAEYDFPKVEGSEPVGQIHWDTMDMYPYAKLKTLNNTLNYMKVDEEGKPSPMSDILTFNEFNGQIRYMEKLPWHRISDRRPGPDGFEWADDDSIRLKAHLSRDCGFDISRNVVEEAITETAHERRFHPVRKMLNELVWDGKPRLDRFLIDYAGARDDEYVRTVCKITLIQAVARVFDPGCQADTVLVLEGGQGVGKTTLCKMLGGIFYADISLDPSNKDTIDAMRGRWIIEISEMGGTGKADVALLKAFLTRKSDLYRPAYGKRTIEVPRQSIFIGTINLNATGQYLTDTTGNRRWLPVLIKQLKFAEFEKAVPQIWAEAVDMYFSGEASYMRDPEVIKLALDQQFQRQTVDDWASRVISFLDENPHKDVVSIDIWEYMGGQTTHFNTYHGRRIAECLNHAGYKRTRRRPRGGGKPQWVYSPPGSEIAEEFGDLLG